jgi:hypothetical protein
MTESLPDMIKYRMILVYSQRRKIKKDTTNVMAAMILDLTWYCWTLFKNKL